MDLSEKNIESLIVRDFPAQEKVQVQKVLADLEALRITTAHTLNRIIIAVLYLADGDLEKLLHYVDAALADPRDVLFWAEYNGQNTISDNYKQWLTRHLD